MINMKKFVSVLICVVALLSVFSFSAFAVESTVETAQAVESTQATKKTETTEFVLEIDVNKRYTNFANETQADEVQEKEDEKIDGKKSVYIAILCAALVVSVVILAVSLKRVPKEEDIDISGQSKNKKGK